MLITLSPSKSQDFVEAPLSKKYSKPTDIDDSELLIKELKKINSKQIQEMMAVSENIAKLNVGRFRSFSTPFTTKMPNRQSLELKVMFKAGWRLKIFPNTDIPMGKID